MEKQLLIISFALGVIALLTILFNVYRYFKQPQDDSKIKEVGTEKELGTKATILEQKEAEKKASLLAQQVQAEKEYNTKKFIDLSERFDNTDRKIETLTKSVNSMNLELSKQLMRVGTIIEEHMKITT